MIQVTLVFYQFSDALHELEQWEKQQNVFKDQVDDRRIVYTLINKDEKLFCFDINSFTFAEVNDIINSKTYTYKKTLVFGKVNLLNLIKLQQILMKIEL